MPSFAFADSTKTSVGGVLAWIHFARASEASQIQITRNRGFQWQVPAESLFLWLSDNLQNSAFILAGNKKGQGDHAQL